VLALYVVTVYFVYPFVRESGVPQLAVLLGSAWGVVVDVVVVVVVAILVVVGVSLDGLEGVTTFGVTFGDVVVGALVVFSNVLLVVTFDAFCAFVGFTFDGFVGVTFGTFEGVTFDAFEGVTFDAFEGVTFDAVESVTLGAFVGATFCAFGGSTFGAFVEVEFSIFQGHFKHFPFFSSQFLSNNIQTIL